MNLPKMPNLKEFNHNKYSSENYYQARDKFKEATKVCGMNTSVEIIVDDLSIDFAISETPKKDKLLILVSGVHGVEGYVGSMFQLYFLENIYPKLKDKVSVCLVHSLNPYGFKNNRRVNQNNVDLNRNFSENFKDMLNPKIMDIIKNNESIFEANRPRKNKLKENYKLYTTIFKSAIKNGIVETIEAGVVGQSLYSTGINYSGTKPEQENIIFRKYISKITEGYNEVTLLDLHTGLGRKFEMSGSTYHKKDSEEYKYCKKIIKNLASHTGVHIYNLYSLAKGFLKETKAKKNYEILIEFGTISPIASALSASYLSHLLVVENQITFQGPKERLEHIRNKMKNAYYPKSALYNLFVCKEAEKVGKRLLKIYN